jgi:hypothetical protein
MVYAVQQVHQSKSDEPRLATSPHGLLGLLTTIDHTFFLIDLQHVLETLLPLQATHRREHLTLLLQFQLELVWVDHGIIVPLVGMVPNHDHGIGREG